MFTPVFAALLRRLRKRVINKTIITALLAVKKMRFLIGKPHKKVSPLVVRPLRPYLLRNFFAASLELLSIRDVTFNF